MYSLFTQDQYRLFDGRWTVDGGIRMDKKHYGDDPVTGLPTHDWAKEVYTYSLGTAYKLTRILTLTGRYAYSENTIASYQVDPTTRAALPPERDSRYEGGVLANIHPAFTPALMVFYYDTKNEKVSSTGLNPYTGQTVSYYVNPATGEETDYVTTSDMRTKGVEFKVNGQLLKSLTYGSLQYGLRYTYVTTDNHTQNVSIAHNMASGLLSYRFRNVFANVAFVYEGPHNLSTSPAGVIYYQLGDFTRMDANVGCNFKVFNRDTRIAVYARNLGDVHYATRYVSGAYLDPGLTYGVELRYSFF